MSEGASVRGDERLRLFVALRLPNDVLEAIVAWQERAFRVGAVRVVPRESLHVTLAFLGRRPRAEITGIVAELRAAARAARRIQLLPADGRYRETRSVGMLVLGDEAGTAAALAEDVQARLERLGVYEREQRPWLPHVTVIRFRRPPRLAPGLPELGRFSPSEVALYHSVLRRSGAQYEVRESVPLGG